MKYQVSENKKFGKRMLKLIISSIVNYYLFLDWQKIETNIKINLKIKLTIWSLKKERRFVKNEIYKLQNSNLFYRTH